MPKCSCECVKQIHITRALYASHAWWVHNFPRLQRSKFWLNMVIGRFCFAEKDLFSGYIKQIMNVFSFVQWNKYFHSVKDEMFRSTRLRLVEWNISSFTSWKYLYHCTHKHSLFVYYTPHYTSTLISFFAPNLTKPITSVVFLKSWYLWASHTVKGSE